MRGYVFVRMVYMNSGVGNSELNGFLESLFKWCFLLLSFTKICCIVLVPLCSTLYRLLIFLGQPFKKFPSVELVMLSIEKK